MSESRIQVETLDNGLRAAFVNMSHFRSSAVRLTINAGAIHETPETAGAAHFLEHITFQGTEGMPAEEDMHRFSEDNGLSRNAFTNKTVTSYVADGFDLEPAAYFVAQAALFPRLTPEALERERKPIVDELRGYTSDPYYYTRQAHSQALGGSVWSSPTGGTTEDVMNMTHEHLTEYYDRNYRLGNAVLVVCSGASVDEQREYTELLLAPLKRSGEDRPVPVELPVFNPQDLSVSLQQVNLSEEAQTGISLAYALPEALTEDDEYTYNLVSAALSKMAHRRLRSELAICYGASASVPGLLSNNFNQRKSWAYMATDASLDGSDAVAGLNALHDVARSEISDDLCGTLMATSSHNADYVLESNPIAVANNTRDILAYSARSQHEVIDLEAFKGFAARITPDMIRKAHREIVSTKPLVIATSPSAQVLERIHDWAARRG